MLPNTKKRKLDTWLEDNLNTWADTPNGEWFANRIRKIFGEQCAKTGKPVIIGLCGQAGAGKDSAITYLGDILFCEKVAFADPLKKIAGIVGFTQKQLTDRTLKETPDEFWGISPRQFLQMCGTEMFRKVWREDVWTELLRKQVAVLSEERIVRVMGFPSSKYVPRDIIFVTDVRFPNEAETIKKMGGYVVRITRPNNPFAIANQHASESQVASLPVDLELTNNQPDAETWSWKFARFITTFFKKEAFFWGDKKEEK